VLQGSIEELSFNPVELPTEIQDALVAVAVQRVFRERTAGKLDSAEDRKAAAKNIQDQWQAWMNGDLQIARQGKVELSEEETAATIARFIVNRKRSLGDKRSENEILAIWQKLPSEKQQAVLDANKKEIKKVLREQLNIKRGKASKIDF
jgi:predicted Fe-S protein YdhL (DUF1289 family)